MWLTVSVFPEVGNIVVPLANEIMEGNVAQGLSLTNTGGLGTYIPRNKDQLVRSQHFFKLLVLVLDMDTSRSVISDPLHSAVQVHQVLGVPVFVPVHVQDEKESWHINEINYF